MKRDPKICKETHKCVKRPANPTNIIKRDLCLRKETYAYKKRTKHMKRDHICGSQMCKKTCKPEEHHEERPMHIKREPNICKGTTFVGPKCVKRPANPRNIMKRDLCI